MHRSSSCLYWSSVIYGNENTTFFHLHAPLPANNGLKKSAHDKKSLLAEKQIESSIFIIAFFVCQVSSARALFLSTKACEYHYYNKPNCHFTLRKKSTHGTAYKQSTYLVPMLCLQCHFYAKKKNIGVRISYFE